jgi:3-hydroxybutyryl-CoA dehydrogenase
VNIKRFGVVGAGSMGSGIAEVITQAGFDVVVYCRNALSAERCRGRLARALGCHSGPHEDLSPGDSREHKIRALQAAAAMARVHLVTDLQELASCQLVIEAVVEDLEVKERVMADLDHRCPPQTTLTSTTCTLPIVALAMATRRPDRVCGTHFFHPAPVMPLVEIVPAATTSQDTVDVLRRFTRDCAKSPVLAADRAGFIVNALLFRYLNEAIRMSERGVATPSDIDAAMRGGCGFPMGPFELLDEVGLDTSLTILETLHAENGDPASRPAPLLQRLVTSNQLGRKTGQGFYSYSPGDGACA